MTDAAAERFRIPTAAPTTARTAELGARVLAVAYNMAASPAPPLQAQQPQQAAQAYIIRHAQQLARGAYYKSLLQFAWFG